MLLPRWHTPRRTHVVRPRTDVVSVGISTVRRERRLRRLRGDAGTSLTELVVGMSVLSIFLAMFTGAVVMLNQATNKSQAITLSSQQLNQAFLSLDKMVRYAAAISTPGCAGTTTAAQGCDGTTSGDWYVELRTTNTGVEVCTQLRVDITTQQLQKRNWNAASLPTIAPPFTPMASGVTNVSVAAGSTDQPFALVAPSTTAPYQQLTLNLVAVSGSASTQATTSRSKSTFAALNSSIPAPTSPICQQEGRP